jgi:hypothetical protein
MMGGFSFLDWLTSKPDYFVNKRGIMLRRALALCIATAILAPAPSALAQRNNQQQQQQPKRSKAEQADIDALSGAVDFAAAGKTATDVGLTWEMSHFLKSPDGSTEIPFVITVDKATLPAKEASVYIRLMEKSQIPALAAIVNATGQEKTDKDDKDKKEAKTPPPPPSYPWQNIYFIEVPQDGKIARAIAVAPGEDEMFVAVKERAKDDKSKTPPKIGVLQKSLTVPDFNNGQLATSEVIVAKGIEQLQQPLPQNKLAENPYVFGPLRVMPTVDGKFGKSGELNLVFWIYNAGVSSATSKPDVQVEYNFNQKTADGEKFFNRTQPSQLNATTLPPEFDFAKGHQLTEVQSIPLASFPPGDYRLEIKVTDKTNSKTVTQNVNFNVAAS